MNSINVFIYSYKVKDLLKNILSIINNESHENKIIYHIFDQNTLDRSYNFKSIKNTFYRHISWDDTKGIPFYRKHVLFDQRADYFLELSPNISLTSEWDNLLIKSLKENTIISGNFFKNISIKNSNLVFNKKYNDVILESNFIDMDLIFLKQKDSIFLNQLNCLKHYGQELFASTLSLNKGIKIFSMNSTFYKIKSVDQDIMYYPYSKTHGYNEMIDIINNLNNDLFESFHKIKVSAIPKLPYQINDVPYSDVRISLDNANTLKFHSGYNKIEVL